MNPETIAQIIKLALELAIRIHDDMPQAQRTKFWTDHAKMVTYIEALFKQLQPDTKPQDERTTK